MKEEELQLATPEQVAEAESKANEFMADVGNRFYGNGQKQILVEYLLWLEGLKLKRFTINDVIRTSRQRSEAINQMRKSQNKTTGF